MKITDLSLIFIGILLPMIIVVYVNVSFTIKAQEQEIYYKQVIDIASEDATKQMKEVENEDSSIDYGYSGSESNKISVNAQVAVDTFLDSIYNNFGIKGNEAAESYMQLFIPAIAIIDYDGVQVSSVESFVDNGEEVIRHALKPKRYYSYMYTVAKKSGKNEMVEGYITDGANGYTVDSYHQIDFTMDDYITHRWSSRSGGKSIEEDVTTFYISDANNNGVLAGNQESDTLFVDSIANKLQEIRKDVIVDIVVKDLAYAVNTNNSYARSAGISYSFSFPTSTQSDLYASVENVGFMAFVQGLSVGNKYLNAKTYGITNLQLATRYYFTIPRTESEFTDKYGSIAKLNLYHKSKNCEIYKAFSSGIANVSPKYVLSKQKAASAKVKLKKGGEYIDYEGFYPCPYCIP